MRRQPRNERGISTPGGMLAAAGVVTILAGSFVLSQGMIRVSVDQKRPGGEHVHLTVPGAIVPAALAFIPAREIGRHMPLEAKQHLPVAEAAVQELSNLPDCTLVEFDSRDEHVKIRIRDGKVVIDVNDGEDEVHVTLPLSTARSVVRKMARAAEYASDESLAEGCPFGPHSRESEHGGHHGSHGHGAVEDEDQGGARDGDSDATL